MWVSSFLILTHSFSFIRARELRFNVGALEVGEVGDAVERDVPPASGRIALYTRNVRCRWDGFE